MRYELNTADQHLLVEQNQKMLKVKRNEVELVFSDVLWVQEKIYYPKFRGRTEVYHLPNCHIELLRRDQTTELEIYDNETFPVFAIYSSAEKVSINGDFLHLFQRKGF